jgi:uncharacterized protein (TIGR03083 family)
VSTGPSRWVSAVRRSQDRLAALAGGLDAAGRRAPSYDTEWNIAQVFSHLGSQAEIFGLLLDAGLSGGDAPGPDSFPPIWDAWNARSPEDQVADSVAANEEFVARLESLDDTQWSSFELAAFGMQLDAVKFLRLRLPEHAIHTWDVAVTLDPSATVASDAVELIVDGLGDMVARVGRPRDEPATLEVSTTAPERSFALVTNGVALEPWSARDVAGSLQLSSEELLRLVYGRLDPGHARTVRLEASGITVDDLRAMFPGV